MRGYIVASIKAFLSDRLLGLDIETRFLVSVGDDPADIVLLKPKRPKADKREILVVDAETGVSFSIDLHWDLFSYAQLGGVARGATDWAWDRATAVPKHPLGPMYVLPESARIAFLTTHAALDHRFRLILFRDLAEVARRVPDWEQLHEFASRWRLRSS